MKTGFSRRDFIGSLLASAASGGCASGGKWWFGEMPRIKFGVISDIHITTPESTDRFRIALARYRDLGADAVIVAGDLTDWGLKSSLQFMADAWNDVFPDDRGADGEKVAKLFVTGNHDLDGWRYGDMTLDMHTQGYSEDEAMSKLGIEKCWREVFGEPYGKMRIRTVKGYQFVSAQWHGNDDAEIAAWLGQNSSRLNSTGNPFFFFRHYPIPGTGIRSPRSNMLTEAFRSLPDAVVFTGHTHQTFFDERAIWQDGFTSVAIPSMSYTGVPKGYENGSASRRGDEAVGMERIDSRERLLQPQGFFVKVWDDRMEIERYDYSRMKIAASPWVVPLGAGRAEPFALGERIKTLPVPQFPEGAALETYVTNSDTRNALWRIFMTLEFPAAGNETARAYDYEIRVEFADGRTGAVKRFLSPGFYRLPDEDDKVMRFRFDCMDLPERGKYRFAVYPRNSLGVYGRPIVSKVFESKPGREKAV